MTAAQDTRPTGTDSTEVEYAILLPGDESGWESVTDEERARVYDRHREFIRLLADRGHTMTGGAELSHSRETRQVSGGLDRVSVTDGPYAETVEQLTGFYLVRTANLDDLLQVCGQLTGSGGVVEVRACVPEPAQ